MPLKKGFSKGSIGKNIAKLRGEGKSGGQAVAAALSTAQKAADEKGVPEKGPGPKMTKAQRLARMAKRLKGMKKE